MEAASHDINYFFNSLFRRKRLCPSILDGYRVHLVGVYIHGCNMAVFYITFHSLAVACISIAWRQVTTNGCIEFCTESNYLRLSWIPSVCEAWVVQVLIDPGFWLVSRLDKMEILEWEMPSCGKLLNQHSATDVSIPCTISASLLVNTLSSLPNNPITTSQLTPNELFTHYVNLIFYVQYTRSKCPPTSLLSAQSQARKPQSTI